MLCPAFGRQSGEEGESFSTPKTSHCTLRLGGKRWVYGQPLDLCRGGRGQNGTQQLCAGIQCEAVSCVLLVLPWTAGLRAGPLLEVAPLLILQQTCLGGKVNIPKLGPHPSVLRENSSSFLPKRVLFPSSFISHRVFWVFHSSTLFPCSGPPTGIVGAAA